MLGHKFASFSGTPRGSVYGFKVAQFFKNCTRPVWNCHIKESFTKELPHYHLQTQHHIAARLHHIVANEPSSIFVQFDFMAYYDQFALSESVSAYFCFLGSDGATHALTRMPMGFTLACAIAQATTWQLLNFERRSTVFTCIDNVAFVGSPDAVHHDVRLFLERCHTVHATLNELTRLQIEDFLASSHTQQLASVTSWHKDAFTFLGVAYLWSAKTKSLSKKTLDKLLATRQCLAMMNGTILPRQLAAIVGLLRYANYVLRLDALERYYTLDWIRNVSKTLQTDVALWDSVEITLPPAHRQALLAWFDVVTQPCAVPIHDPLPADVPPAVLLVDASASGWGAILYDGVASYRTASGLWPAAIPSSVSSEPAATVAAAKHFFADGAPPLVFIGSDHQPLVHASYASAPRAPPYNNSLLSLKWTYPTTRFVHGHVPGHLNPSDSLSRDGSSDSITLQHVQTATGMGWDYALTAINKPKPCPKCSLPPLPWQC